MRSRCLAVLALIAIVATGCGDASLDMDAWTERWRETASLLPDDPDAFTPTVCEQALVQLREARSELVPAPTEELEVAVDRWIARAEEVVFDCPPPGGFRTALEGLATLEAEVEAALAGS